MAVYAPNSNYRTVLKFGFSGFDVWASQVALNSGPLKPGLVEDGAYGRRTEAAVKAAQTQLVVTVDGVLGPQTQDRFCVRECWAAQVHLTPVGLLIGICRGESGAIFAATTPAYSDGSRDYFAFQRNMRNPTQDQLRAAADVHGMAVDTGVKLAARHRSFMSMGAPNEEAWKLAVLSYNWPAAAEALAEGRANTWTYSEYAGGPELHLSHPAPWVERFKIPGVTTGQQWCDHYISTKTGSVTSWTVA